MRNVYDKLLNINFNKITGLKMDDENLRELGEAENEARKQELLLGTTRNRVINDNFNRLNKIQQESYEFNKHSKEKLKKSTNISRIFKK